MRRILFFLVLVLAGAQITLAGAWGAGAFDNDDAADWTATLVKHDTVDPVYQALRAGKSSSYLEAPQGAIAIAAAEVIAALGRKPGGAIPERLASWVKRQNQVPTPEQCQ